MRFLNKLFIFKTSFIENNDKIISTILRKEDCGGWGGRGLTFN